MANDGVCTSQIDDLSREVGKLKDALNSLSQLSYSSGSPSKRQQQNQQVETMQQQIKQLQYQLAVRCPTQNVSLSRNTGRYFWFVFSRCFSVQESKKQHHEIVSVYRMHLLYAVQVNLSSSSPEPLHPF